MGGQRVRKEGNETKIMRGGKQNKMEGNKSPQQVKEKKQKDE
jgi:hypothetical protein